MICVFWAQDQRRSLNRIVSLLNKYRLRYQPILRQFATGTSFFFRNPLFHWIDLCSAAIGVGLMAFELRLGVQGRVYISLSISTTIEIEALCWRCSGSLEWISPCASKRPQDAGSAGFKSLKHIVQQRKEQQCQTCTEIQQPSLGRNRWRYKVT